MYSLKLGHQFVLPVLALVAYAGTAAAQADTTRLGKVSFETSCQ